MSFDNDTMKANSSTSRNPSEDSPNDVKNIPYSPGKEIRIKAHNPTTISKSKSNEEIVPLHKTEEQIVTTITDDSNFQSGVKATPDKPNNIIQKVIPSINKETDSVNVQKQSEGFMLDDLVEAIDRLPSVEDNKIEKPTRKYSSSFGYFDMLFEDDEVNLFRTDEGSIFAEAIHNKRKYQIPLGTPKGKIDLIYYRDKSYKTVQKEPLINMAYRGVTGFAEHEGTPICVEPRIFQDGEDIYYDLHDESKPKYVLINKEKYSVVEEDDLRFRHGKGLAQQAIPQDGGSIDLLDRYFNLDDDQLFLLKIFIICAFIPTIQHPVILLEGKQNSGKTTIAKNLSAIIDPTVTEILTLPTDEKSLHLNFSQHYFIAYDNMYDVSQDISDNLCRAATGIGIEKRSLYTDDDVTILKFRRAILISGMDLGSLREDLISRCIKFQTLPTVNKVPGWPASEMHADFKKEKPLILGAILDIIVKAMSLHSQIHIETVSRMDDFEVWGYTFAEVLGKGLGERFHRLFKENMENQMQTLKDDNPLLASIKYLMEDRDIWEGEVSTLYSSLHDIVKNKYLDSKSIHWPGNASALGRKLRKIETDLEDEGIWSEPLKPKSNYRGWCFKKNVNPENCDSAGITNKDNDENQKLS